MIGRVHAVWVDAFFCSQRGSHLFNRSDSDSHSSTVWACDFDATGKRLVSCSDDKTVKIWQSYEKNNREGRDRDARETGHLDDRLS